MWKNPEKRQDAIAGNANPCCMRKNPEKKLDGIAGNANPCRMRKNPKQRLEASSGRERHRERQREIHTYLNGAGELQVLAAVADLHHGRVFAGLAGRYPTTFGERFLGVDVHGIDHHPPTHVHLLRLLSLPPCTPPPPPPAPADQNRTEQSRNRESVCRVLPAQSAADGLHRNRTSSPSQVASRVVTIFPLP
jgi:hypothetical protein